MPGGESPQDRTAIEQRLLARYAAASAAGPATPPRAPSVRGPLSFPQ